MSVFVSWGEKESLSHEGALLLQKWLPEVLPNLKSFVSSENIATGSLWLQELFKQLEVSESGILCLTKETVERSWILFEAGALAKRLSGETGRVCPLLFEFKSLSHPLGAFQARALDKNDELASKKEMFLLVKTLNNNRDTALCLGGDHLESYFERTWTLFWNPYVKLCEKHASTKKPQAAATVTNKEILAELVEMRGAFRQFADVLMEIRRPAELQQFTVQCPFCKNVNEVLMPDHAGATKPTICSSCGARFNAHITGEHSVFVRPITAVSTLNAPPSQPTIVEKVECPVCQEALAVELPEHNGATRTPWCPKCGNKVYIRRRTGGGVLVRTGGQSLETANGWWPFLNDTQCWVDPAALPHLVSITAAVSSGEPDGAELNSDGLCKKIFLRMDSAAASGFSRSMVRVFIKVIFFGGAFHFPDAVRQTTWKTPFSNKLVPKDLIYAYARGTIRRLRNKFVLTANELPDLRKLLFPPEIAEAEDALREALAEAK